MGSVRRVGRRSGLRRSYKAGIPSRQPGIDVATGDNQWTDNENGRHFTIYPLEGNREYYNHEMDSWLIKKAKL